MNLIESIKSAISQLLGNKTRTFLTMLGMFIGIGAVIMVLGVGSGVKTMMMSTFKDIGKGLVSIEVKNRSPEYMLTQNDLEAIEEMKAVNHAILKSETSWMLLKDYKNEEIYADVTGVPYNINQVEKLKLTGGRMYTEAEEKAKAKVAVISDIYAETILGIKDKEAAIGKEIEMTIGKETHSFEIIGLIESKNSFGLTEKEIEVYIPFATMDQISNFGDYRSYVGAFIVEDGYNAETIAYQVGRLLDKRHITQKGYTASSAKNMVDAFDKSMNKITAFVGLVAAISLLVGGIGIMNIMLVTVKERTREIGVRKAVGASNKEIMRQFLVEALILTLLGGLSGLLIGYVGAFAIGKAMKLTIELTPSMILFAVGTSSAIGVIFGVYPARQASKLEPVEALRYE